jgi:hypothetical protein
MERVSERRVVGILENGDGSAAQRRLGDSGERHGPGERVGQELHPLMILHEGAAGRDDLVHVR